MKANLIEGVLPLWNPSVGMGAPLLANYQLGFFYPPNWFYLIGGFLAGAKGIAWLQAGLVALHLLWTGIGMLLLARELKLNILGQFIASLAFTFSGYIIARAWFLTINHAVAWIPWILLFGYKLAVRLRTDLQEHKSSLRILTSSGFLGLVLCATLQLLTGHAQISWYTGILNFFWILFWVFIDVPAAGVESPTTAGKDRKQRLLAGGAAAGLFLLAMFLSVGMAALQLFPTAEYLGFSPRASEVSYEIAMTYSFWPWRFIGLIAPNLFGNPVFGNYWGYANFWEDAIYIGLIPFLLAVRSIFGIKRAPGYANLTKFLIGVCVLAFILALGKNLPVFPFLYRHVPTFDMFNGPTRWSILAVFSLSLLAAIGAQTWLRPTGRGLYWTRLGTAGAFAVMLGAGLAWFALRDSAGADRLETMVLAMALAGLWAIGGGILSLVAPTNDPGQGFHLWYLPVVIWVLLDLLVAGYGLNPASNLELYDADLVPPLKNDGRVFLPEDVEYDLKFDHYFRFDQFQSVDDWLQIRRTYLPNLAILNHYTPLVNNFDPLLLDRLEIWINTIDELPDEAAAKFLNLSNVSAVVNKDETSTSETRISIIQPGQEVRWFSCASSIPEANKLLAAMKAQPDLLFSILYLEQSSSETTGGCLNQSVAEIGWQQNTSHSKRIQVGSSTPGWLMISESWYPGWHAKVDGRSVELIRADYIFQAVPVPAGEHIVEVYYSPNSFKLGLFVTIFSTVMMIFIITIKRLRPSNSIGRKL
ncbi:MAG: YfhO family protein [Anaerolineales bacterium]